MGAPLDVGREDKAVQEHAFFSLGGFLVGLLRAEGGEAGFGAVGGGLFFGFEGGEAGGRLALGYGGGEGGAFGFLGPEAGFAGGGVAFAAELRELGGDAGLLGFGGEAAGLSGGLLGPESGEGGGGGFGLGAGLGGGEAVGFGLGFGAAALFARTLFQGGIFGGEAFFVKGALEVGAVAAIT